MTSDSRQVAGESEPEPERAGQPPTTQPSDKARSLAWIRFAYTTALIGACVTGSTLVSRGAENPIYVAFVSYVVGTLILFGFSRAFANSSFYDAYWSLAPPVIAFYWTLTAVSPDVDPLRGMLVLILVLAWSIRLTFNWMRGWSGLDHEDWRYSDLRKKSGGAWFFVDLGGIHLLPTVQVFLGCLCIYPALSDGRNGFGALDFVAVTVTSLAIWYEMTADRQLHEFVHGDRQPGEILTRGVWATSRHPNYFGEVLFWWGLYLFGLAANPAYWWTAVGPLAITALFAFVSIPLLDTRSLERRPGYEAHMRRVSALIPWFTKAP